MTTEHDERQIDIVNMRSTLVFIGEALARDISSQVTDVDSVGNMYTLVALARDAAACVESVVSEGEELLATISDDATIRSGCHRRIAHSAARSTLLGCDMAAWEDLGQEPPPLLHL